MTFNEAKVRLKELAKGRYCSLSYEITTRANGEEYSDCTLYLTEPGLSGLSFSAFKKPSWDEAFREMEHLLATPIPPKGDEAPK